MRTFVYAVHCVGEFGMQLSVPYIMYIFFLWYSYKFMGRGQGATILQGESGPLKVGEVSLTKLGGQFPFTNLEIIHIYARC